MDVAGVERRPAAAAVSETAGMVAHGGDSCPGESDVMIQRAGGEHLCSALAAAADDQVLAVPFRQTFHVFQRTHEPHIHPFEIIFITVVLVPMGIAGRTELVKRGIVIIFLEIVVKTLRLAVLDAVRVDVQRDHTAGGHVDPFIGTADARSVKPHKSRTAFGFRIQRDAEISRDGFFPGAGNFHIIELDPFFFRDPDFFQHLHRNCGQFFFDLIPEGIEIFRFPHRGQQFFRLDHRSYDAPGLIDRLAPIFD